MYKRTGHDQMMMKIKKKLTGSMFLLAAVVICSLTAGCAQNGDRDGESVTVVVEDVSEVEETAEPAETDMTSAAPAETEEEITKTNDQEVKDQGSGDDRNAAAKTADGEEPDRAETKGAAIEGDEADRAETKAAALEEADVEATSVKAAENAPADPSDPETTKMQENQDGISFDGESDLEYNARQIMLADASITKEGALGVAAYLWHMGFGRMSGYPTVGEVNGGTVLTVFDEEGLFYNIILTPEGKIQQVEDVEGNELISLGTKAGERVKPPLSGADVIALLEEWKSHGGHGEVVAAYNQFAGDYGRSRMSSSDLWCSETVSAAYAALGAADRIGGMASNGFSYEKNARSIGAWVSGGGYIPNIGDIVITQDSAGERHNSCVVSCDGHTIHTIAGGGSSIHHGSISVGSDRIAGFVVPEW